MTIKRLPNVITLAMGFVGSLALLLLSAGESVLAVRLAFLAFALDVLDGYLARRLDAVSEKGAMLDRLFDRIYQVVLPVILYLRMTSGDYLSIIYGAVLITASLWRIAEVRPTSLWFHGLPMNIHAVIIISSFLSGTVIPPYVMLLLLIPTVLPIKYVRRLGTSQASNRGTFWQIRLIVPAVLAIVPYQNVKPIFQALIILSIVYVLVGWIPPLKYSRGRK